MTYNCKPWTRYNKLKSKLEDLLSIPGPFLENEDMVERIEKDMQECIEDIKFEDIPREWIVFEGEEKIQEYTGLCMKDAIHEAKQEISEVSYQEWIECGFGDLKANGDIYLKHVLKCNLTGEEIDIFTIITKP